MDRFQLLNDSEAATRYALDGRQGVMWTAMPGIVQSVNLTAMTLVAQLAIQGEQTNPDGSITQINISPLVDVPIVFPSAGGFTLTLPITVGDEVLIVIASRCIDAWWQNGGFANVAMEARMHDLSDGFAIPGPRSQPRVISGISSTNAQLRHDSGTVYIEITPSGVINLVAPSGVNITGDLDVTGNITSNETITGETVVAEVESVIAGIVFTTHHHIGITPGPDYTGPPS